MSSRLAAIRRAGSKRQAKPARGSETPWKNKKTGRLKKGWKYQPGNQVQNVATGEIFDR